VAHWQFRPLLVSGPVGCDVDGHASVPLSVPHWHPPVEALIVEGLARHDSVALTTHADLSAPPPPAIQIVSVEAFVTVSSLLAGPHSAALAGELIAVRQVRVSKVTNIDRYMFDN
jgi:hypothetical protein